MNFHWDIIGSLGTLILAIGGAIWKRLSIIRENDMTQLNEKLDKMLKEWNATRELTLRIWDKLEKHIQYHLDQHK